MIIAFSTTVVGLLIGIGAYFTSMLQNRWLNEDIKNIEYLTEGIMRKYEISKKKDIGFSESTLTCTQKIP